MALTHRGLRWHSQLASKNTLCQHVKARRSVIFRGFSTRCASNFIDAHDGRASQFVGCVELFLALASETGDRSIDKMDLSPFYDQIRNSPLPRAGEGLGVRGTASRRTSLLRFCHVAGLSHDPGFCSRQRPLTPHPRRGEGDTKGVRSTFSFRPSPFSPQAIGCGGPRRRHLNCPATTPDRKLPTPPKLPRIDGWHFPHAF